MKYIRTKDGVYDTSKGIYTPGINMWAIGTITIYDEQILKQADTIEELCDEFIMTHYFKETNYTKCEVLKDDKDLMIKAVILRKQHNKDKDLKNEFNIYGAIWTDKGLIYVAKMNDKGELELI